jgi:hypothetical protein
VWRRAQEKAQNVHARLLLLLARVRRGELGEEVASLKEIMEANLVRKKQKVVNFYYKMKFAPSFLDKSSLLGEALWNQKFTFISFLVFILLSLPH